MPIQFTCPHCGVHSSVDDQYVGQTGPCAGCGQTVTISPQAPGAMSSVPVPKKSSSSATTIIVIVVCSVLGLFVCGGILVSLLVPAVGGAREAARRAQCVNNTKQIVLALHNYHDTNGSFPPAYTTDENGKPMHSWRVLILPYLESSGAWDAYDMEQPWDSPQNLAVAQNAPPLYRCPSSDLPQSETNYFLITGPGTLFEGDTSKRMRDITDGMSNTAIVVEASGSGVLWTQPTDIDIEAFARGAVDPQENIMAAGDSVSPSSYHPGVFIVGNADGSVNSVSNEIAPQILRAKATISGGESVDFSEF